MDNPEYCEINSNITLNYVNQLLMEESADENISTYKHHDALQAMEKPFYDILGKAYPSSPKQTVINSGSQSNFPDDINNNYHDLECSGSSVSDILGCKAVRLIDIDGGSELCNVVLQFNRTAEEARKLVPSIEKLVVDPESNGLSSSKQTIEATIGQHSKHTNKIRSHPHVDLELVERRNSKHSAISTSEIIRDEIFDRVLLCDEQYHCDVAHLREMKAKEANISLQYVRNTGSAQGKEKSQGKKQEKEEVDLRALLIQCAQAISSNNHPFASELLKKIRHHSSPYGDGFQRLAIYFADALEARVAGTGSQMYQKLVVKQTSCLDMLKAYSLFIAASPFVRVAYYFGNKTIVDVLGGRPRVHIIDFGILFGFQWPSLIQRLAKREGGPPQLRITGINVPETGFRPCKTIEETGKRLAEYARMFNVPFQYQGVASRWEDIYIPDLNIDKDEVLIVNCLHKMKNLGDETEDIDSARDRVLRIMKRMNPNVLIIGVMNGLYSSPFFLPRFREALFYYSSQFDMLNSTVAQNHEARILIERDLLGADVFNVVACEGAERIERPESYKQWQVRILKAGFKQLPVNQTILKSSLDRKELYHEDFVIDEDSGWLLQGWKGRIMHALSSWKRKDS
ncbi:scarecrow-like protein 9 [Sorghum bicolor]|uniref:Uncharacterized protein n=1 Tax=Sorghum bicolor TaxID=4558 RepID=A0A1B6P5S1_SORBI|nr:scarecrow-like protein 9 [Sorghum bicolor]KXG21080.1 hypothetical protein SORBI_3009G011100 [Sorghum bicolor]OQU77220.1 hypothetical protein SORBI_3009G011100 [Sorghum bicolor]OQU77221.1 hypothetical protein SORBI_3009G011100 [Sorghum bicolor]OQU77222.1 hypothetical protein SORBI_3009G011100 [Sorghum bicolor]|eukprot:XP_002440450.2 scarecrow-like protein 9 [Sorghum bicolor]